MTGTVRITSHIILLLCGLLPLQAQSLSSVGVMAAGAASTQSWSYTKGASPETGYRIGYGAGLFVEGFRARGISFIWELWYLQRGLTTKVGAAAVEPSLTYISMPILMKVRFGDDGFAYYLTAGPRIEYLFHIEPQRMTALTDALSEGESDFGVSAGAGIQFPLGPVPDLHLECRYTMSILPIYNSDALTIRNSSIDLLLGIGF
ncbi:MAG: PorT family protein [Bacteroidetes bacterium]|nr:PorT family protein [Bacteroidota bacterium]